MCFCSSDNHGSRGGAWCQIWWVVRTRYNFIVEMKKKFYITEPECDWDFINQETAIFRTIHSVDWAAYGETPPTDDDLSGL